MSNYKESFKWILLENVFVLCKSQATSFSIERYLEASIPKNLTERLKCAEILRLKEQDKSNFCVQRKTEGDKVRYENFSLIYLYRECISMQSSPMSKRIHSINFNNAIDWAKFDAGIPVLWNASKLFPEVRDARNAQFDKFSKTESTSFKNSR